MFLVTFAEVTDIIKPPFGCHLFDTGMSTAQFGSRPIEPESQFIFGKTHTGMLTE